MPFYEEEVRYLEANIQTLPRRESQVIFYGSSSIRLWSNFQNCFSWNIINLGFGGSTIAACAWFMPRLLFERKSDFLSFIQCLFSKVYIGYN